MPVTLNDTASYCILDMVQNVYMYVFSTQMWNGAC